VQFPAWVAIIMGMSRQPELPSARVASDLRRRIHAGEWEHDAALPAVAQLAEHYAVSRATVARALRTLAEDGLIRIIPRWGTFRV
jgi:DNA-binding GntR family transcriptional regulator